jgi:hypothetical protein
MLIQENKALTMKVDESRLKEKNLSHSIKDEVLSIKDDLHQQLKKQQIEQTYEREKFQLSF